MILSEAIESLRQWKNPEWIKHHKEAYEAIQLGIEALKRLKELRRYSSHNPKWQLPGETEE